MERLYGPGDCAARARAENAELRTRCAQLQTQVDGLNEVIRVNCRLIALLRERLAEQRHETAQRVRNPWPNYSGLWR